MKGFALLLLCALTTQGAMILPADMQPENIQLSDGLEKFLTAHNNRNFQEPASTHEMEKLLKAIYKMDRTVPSETKPEILPPNFADSMKQQNEESSKDLFKSLLRPIVLSANDIFLSSTKYNPYNMIRPNPENKAENLKKSLKAIMKNALMNNALPSHLPIQTVAQRPVEVMKIPESQVLPARHIITDSVAQQINLSSPKISNHFDMQVGPSNKRPTEVKQSPELQMHPVQQIGADSVAKQINLSPSQISNHFDMQPSPNPWGKINRQDMYDMISSPSRNIGTQSSTSTSSKLSENKQSKTPLNIGIGTNGERTPTGARRVESMSKESSSDESKPLRRNSPFGFF